MRRLLLYKEAVKQFGCRVLKRRDLVCCCLVSAYELRLVFARLSLFRPNILTVEVRLAIESTHDCLQYRRIKRRPGSSSKPRDVADSH
jgi:hypothetical protein